MKTASRVIGTAAVLDGLEAQDSPVYGAERRGAPMAAFVRIADRPIRERGVVATPDLVVLSDETLLDDPAVRPLDGLPRTGVLLLSTTRTPDQVRERTGHAGEIVARDFRGWAVEAVGRVAATSAAMAAAACRLLGLSEAAIESALSTELAAIGLPAAVLLASQSLAARARAGLLPLAGRPAPPAPLAAPAALVEVTYAAPEVATPSVVGPPNTRLRRTGNWRTFRPVIDLVRCTRCWICFVRCPEGAIALAADDTPQVDYEVCKGCLICVEECPIDAIASVREDRRPAAVGPGP
jgi:pyruvate ferredoxin oxidoreductase gamma subunit